MTNMIRLDNEKQMMGIVASLNANGNGVDYICIPDYGKGILYYMHDKKINTKYNPLHSHSRSATQQYPSLAFRYLI